MDVEKSGAGKETAATAAVRSAARRKMYFKMVFASLLRRRSRMLTALLAVVIGATILSGMITVYYETPRQIGESLRAYGANLVLLPREGAMTAEQLTAAKSLLPGGSAVKGVAPYRYETGKISEQPVMVAGTDFAAVRTVSPYWAVSGEYPAARGGEILIGQDVSDLLRVFTGGRITLKGDDAAGKGYSRDFTVSGVLKTGGAEEGFVFMTLDDLDSVMGGERGLLDAAECSVTATESELRGIIADIEAHAVNVTGHAVTRITGAETAILGKLTSLVLLVTVIVLLLTLICVSTTMMAAVAERRREIGLKKALGASDRSIAAEFLGENAALGAVGGVIGIALGFVFAQIVSRSVFMTGIGFWFPIIPITLFASVGITVAACTLSLRSAAVIEPALVLRGE